MTHERANDWSGRHLLYIAEAGQPERAIALGTTMTIGRDTQNDIVLDSITVSRCHALLLRDAAGVRLIDLESTNGTLVNGVPARPDEPVRLDSGNIIQLGQVRARYCAAPPDGGNPRTPRDPARTVQTNDERRTTNVELTPFVIRPSPSRRKRVVERYRM